MSIRESELIKWIAYVGIGLCVIGMIGICASVVDRYTELTGHAWADKTELVAKSKTDLKVKLADFATDNHRDIVEVSNYRKDSNGLWKANVKYYEDSDNGFIFFPIIIP